MICIERENERIDYNPELHTGSHYMASPYTARLLRDGTLKVCKGDGSWYYARPRAHLIRSIEIADRPLAKALFGWGA